MQPTAPLKTVNLDQALDDIRVWVTGNFPFFSVPLAYLPFAEAEWIPSAATDGHNIFFSRGFFSSLAIPEIRFVVLHEILHVVLLHIWRRGNRDWDIWNIALDVMVNGMLLEMLDRRRAADPRWAALCKMPDEGVRDDELFKLGTAELVYEYLKKQSKKVRGKGFDVHDWGKGQGQGAAGKPDQGPSGKDASGKGKGKGRPDRGGGKVGDSTDRSEEQKWKVIVAQAVQVAQRSRQKGDFAGSLETAVGALLRPKIRWTRYLAAVATEMLQDDYDWTEPDEDMLQKGIIIPELYSEGCQVAFALDTSGSMPDQDLREGASEAFGLLSSRGVTGVFLMGCDAAIHYEKMHRKSDPLPEKWGGRGGTNFCPVFERLAREAKIKLLIYFTDGYGTFPKAHPRFRTIWVTRKSVV